MATINPTVEGSSVQWPNVSENDTCTAFRLPKHADISAQIRGTFGGGAQALQGSNDGTNFVTLQDVENADINPTAAAFVSVRDNVAYIRPGVPAGSSASITTTLNIGRRGASG